MAKYRLNKKKFARFLVIVAIIIALIAAAVFFMKNRNGGRCEHEYADGICTICGEKCEHDFADGVCRVCGLKCEHEFENGVCKICSYEDPNYVPNPHPEWPNSTTINSERPLAQAEDDLLVLVNKEYHVAQSYYPNDMVQIDRFVLGVGTDETHQLRRAAAADLNLMFDDAAAEGINLRLRTGFRSYDYQTSLYNSYVQNHGEREANKFSAKPGESEHQSGLAADLAGESQGYALSDYFGDTPEGKWVKENCWRYGFILRYTDGTLSEVGPSTGYIYEAWHVRYIGQKAAAIMHEHPEWTLEEYLEEVNKY